jgi:hypothetical protein
VAKESRSSWWWKWAALVKVNLLARLSQGSGRLIVLTRECWTWSGVLAEGEIVVRAPWDKHLGPGKAERLGFSKEEMPSSEWEVMLEYAPRKESPAS